MTTEERIKKQKELIELIGTHLDKEGHQPITGRVMALLMVMDKEEYTFDEIVEELQISKSSASNALKNLEIRGSIEYITLPGDRKRYFRLKTHNALVMMDDFEKKMINAKEMFNNILDLKADKNSRVSIFFEDLKKIMDFTLELIDEVKKKFA